MPKATATTARRPRVTAGPAPQVPITVDDFILVGGKPAVTISEVLELLRSNTSAEVAAALEARRGDIVWTQWLEPVLKHHPRRIVDTAEKAINAICQEFELNHALMTRLDFPGADGTPGWSIRLEGKEKAFVSVTEVISSSIEAIDGLVRRRVREAKDVRPEPRKAVAA